MEGKREGRLPTSSEDVCSACEVQEDCDQDIDMMLECATTMIQGLVKPANERLNTVIDGVKIVVEDKVGEKMIMISRESDTGIGWEGVAIICVRDVEQ